jgi:hypothetical protein
MKMMSKSDEVNMKTIVYLKKKRFPTAFSMTLPLQSEDTLKMR